MALADPMAAVAEGYGAAAAGEWVAARGAFERALELGDAPEAMFGLAMALWWLGDMAGSVATYERTYAQFRAAEDPTLAAASALRLVLHNKQHLANRPAASGWLARAARLIEERQLGHLRGFLLVLQAYESDDPVAAEGWARAALEMGRAAADTDLELIALSQVGAALVAQGHVADGMAMLDEAMAGALGGDGTALETVVLTTCTTMESCASCASFERAMEWVRACQRFQARYGCPFLYIECRLVYGSVLVATGAWDAAEKELERVVDLSRDAAPSYVAGAKAALAELRVFQGRLEDAERLVAGMEGRNEIAVVAARIHLRRGRPDLAAAMARQRLAVQELSPLVRAPLLEVLGEAEGAGGGYDAAAQRAQELTELGHELGCRVLVARGERMLGRSLAPTDSAASLQHLQVAVFEFTNLDMPFEAACSRRLLAETVAHVDPAAAEAEARTALLIFEHLGAGSEADGTAGLLRDMGVKVARGGPRRLDALTKREQEVLGLVGEGLSNPAIAARLFVSRKTVEHHVANIMAKLGAASRGEAAATARQMAGPAVGR